MKKIRAVIRPHCLESVKTALIKLGAIGMTVSAIQGYGRQKAQKGYYRGTDYPIEFISKISIEVVVEDAKVDATIQAIVVAARTGAIGDGKISVIPVNQTIRIRTSEQNLEAL